VSTVTIIKKLTLVIRMKKIRKNNIIYNNKINVNIIPKYTKENEDETKNEDLKEIKINNNDKEINTSKYKDIIEEVNINENQKITKEIKNNTINHNYKKINIITTNKTNYKDNQINNIISNKIINIDNHINKSILNYYYNISYFNYHNDKNMKIIIFYIIAENVLLEIFNI